MAFTTTNTFIHPRTSAMLLYFVCKVSYCMGCSKHLSHTRKIQNRIFILCFHAFRSIGYQLAVARHPNVLSHIKTSMDDSLGYWIGQCTVNTNHDLVTCFQ